MHSKENLYQQLTNTLVRIDRMIVSAEEEAREMHITPEELRKGDGTFFLAELLVARANTLNGMASLKAMQS